MLNNSTRPKIAKGTPAPAKVKIIKCSYPVGWYRNLIGHIFETDNPSPRYDFIVWEDMEQGRATWRHIKQEDCELLKNTDEPTIACTDAEGKPTS